MNLRRFLARFSRLALIIGAGLPSAWGQNAQIGGQVTDPSGAVVVETAITVANTDTGVVRKTSSNQEGYYVVPLLPPGRYALTAQKEGFKPLSRDRITLQVGDKVTLNLSLEIGAANQTVTITAEVPLLRTEDAQAGLVIDNRRITELPQYNRNPLAFAQLAPNVNGRSDQGTYGSDFRINGGRTNQTEYILDGMPVTTGYLHEVPQSMPSMEGVAEFKVLTNGLSAEYGRLSGGAVVLATKSGTNQFHGGVYEYFKNDKLNANDWNSNRFGRKIGVFHENIFGGSLGGPIAVPKLYNGRDKTFFFLNYEGTRRATGSNAVLASVPTELERQGDFSQSLIDNGKPVQIFDPLTGHLENGRIVRNPFSGNRVPQDRFDPLSKIYLGFYPKANQPPRPNSTSDSNYIFSRSTPSDNNRWTGRLDQNWNGRHATHFSLIRFDSYQSTPRAFSPMEAVGVSDIRSYTVTLEHNWTLTPTTILNLRGGLVRSKSFTGSAVDADSGSWGLQREVLNLLGTTKNRVPAIGGGGVNGLGGGQVQDPRDTSYTGSVSVQKMWGKHTVKAGYDHRRYYSNVTGGGWFSVNSDRIVTARSPDERTQSGAPFASWLLGKVIWGTGEQLAGPASLQTYHGAYFQDDVKVTRKLTVNAGLRWDFEPPRTERFNRQIFWDNDYKWPWQPNVDWSWSQVEQTIGQSLPKPEWMSNGIYGRAARMGTADYPMRTLQQSHPAHFGPHLGFAFQALPRTVVRMSYGLIWLTTTGNWHLSSARWNAGYGDFARLAQDGTPDGGLTYPLSFSTPMPNGAGYVPLTKDLLALNRSVMGNWWLSETAKFDSGYEHDLQLSIQRELGSGNNSWVVELAYNGSLGRNLPAWIGRGEHVLPDAYHKIGPLGTKLLQPVPNPFFGQIPFGSSRGGKVLALGNLYQLNPLWQQISTTGDPDGTANFNSGYLQIEHRFGGGFGFLANYTLGKLMEDTGGIDHSTPGSNRFPQAGLGRSDVYSLSNSYLQNKLVFNYSLELPFGRGKRLLANPRGIGPKALDKIVGGWLLAGTTTVRSGNYLSVSGTNGLWWNAGQASNGASERPVFLSPRVQFDNQVSGHQALEGSPGFTPFMNRAAFRVAQARPDLLEVGDVGWVLPLRGPAFSQWDCSLMKNFGLGKETRYLQLRFEAQNLLNHMNAGNPNGDINSRTFGTITGQTGIPRRAMIAAKIYF